MCVKSVPLSARIGGALVEFEMPGIGVRATFRVCLRERGRAPNRRAPEPAVIHRFVRRLLVFKWPNQLALSLSEGAGDVRALSNSYQLRKAGQHSTQCDALLLAAAVLQGHFNVHITRIPPAQMGRERGQSLPHVRAFLCCEST